MKILRFPIIAADLFTVSVGTDEQRQALLAEALAHRNADQDSMSFSNEGCWRSQFEYKNIDWLMSHLKEVTNNAINYYIETDHAFAQKVKYFHSPEVKYWTNVNEPLSKNSLHVHSLHHFVGLYYIQGYDTGDLVFHNPSNLTETCNPYAPFVSRMAWPPKNGDLLVWPGWMPHETEINQSKDQRVNIAFNIRFQTPQMIYD
jgi:uncharacterized protein (TIGR02466 family)